MQRVSGFANGLRARTLTKGTDVDLGILYPRGCFYLWVTYPPSSAFPARRGATANTDRWSLRSLPEARGGKRPPFSPQVAEVEHVEFPGAPDAALAAVQSHPSR